MQVGLYQNTWAIMTPYMNVSCLDYDAQHTVCVGWETRDRRDKSGVIRIYIFIHMNINTNRIHICINICIHICMYIYVYIYIFIYIYINT